MQYQRHIYQLRVSYNLVQAVMSSRLEARLNALASLPPHTGAAALADLLQALETALDRYPSDPHSQQLPMSDPTLQGLYAGLLQQTLAQLLDSAAASFAALPVMAVADSQDDEALDRQLLHLLGQVGPSGVFAQVCAGQ